MIEHHVELIRASVAPDPEFAEHLGRVLQHVDFDRGVDVVTAELLPLLYRRASALDVDHPQRHRLRYFYLQTWKRNHLLLHRARPVLERLRRTEQPCVVLKGGAIASTRYRDDLGVRPMGDLDLLVAPENGRSIIGWMLDEGWQIDDTLGWSAEQYLRAHHAVSMHHGSDGSIDVHVGLLSTDRNPELDALLLRDAVPAELDGVPIRVLDTTLQVMHTLSHSNPNGLRHLVDVLHLVQTRRSEIDWDVVCEQVINRRSIARTTETIERLTAVAPGVIPDTVVEGLRDAPRHWSDWSHQQRPMASRHGPRIFATRLAQRSRGESLTGRLRIAALLAKHYLHAAFSDGGREPADTPPR